MTQGPTEWIGELLSDERVQSYRRDGFTVVRGVLSKEEAASYRAAALECADRMESHHQGDIFTQLVNVWRSDRAMRRLTFHPKIAVLAEALAGVRLRLWHDQTLIKWPQKSAPTEFHQDQPYWPHDEAPNPISAWIALVDVPPERGCMTFIPNTHGHEGLAPQDLEDPESLFEIRPEWRWAPRTTVPLRAGDCTFHHGRCAHRAQANRTGEPRVAHTAIFTDVSTRYNGKAHLVTDPLGLKRGQILEGEIFPESGAFAQYAGSEIGQL